MEDLYLPGPAGIVEQLDSRMLIILQDGRHLIGTLRTFDQYLNLVLENTVERVIIEGEEIRINPVFFSLKLFPILQIFFVTFL
jgi:small nuclear ribonucleoprotein (snRNP)-like protein